jgi:hypothetical protein
MKVKLAIIDVCEGDGLMNQYTYPETEHIDQWQYSPAICDKVIETVFRDEGHWGTPGVVTTPRPPHCRNADAFRYFVMCAQKSPRSDQFASHGRIHSGHKDTDTVFSR